MFLKLTLRFLALIVLLQISVTRIQAQITSGRWNARLELSETIDLPFRLEIKKNKIEYQFTVYNAKEKIKLRNIKIKSDTFILQFPDFNSVLKFKVIKNELHGHWVNYNRGNEYQIPFTATINQKEKRKKEKENVDFTGKWRTVFDVNTPDSSLAIGVFNSKDNEITGTFLTETGDYRFLEGKIKGNKMYLSCLDGAHAFLFTGEINKGKISGKFYSGTHYTGNWEAIKNADFELKNPEKITYLTSKDPLRFELKDLNNETYNFPNDELKNKVVIIQIMGSWCPNCIDETKFLKKMHEKYKSKGLEIISIGYEIPTNFDEQVQKIKILKERHNLDFQFLVGGKANKETVSKQFSMLNSISSFPTSIFIDREGNVHKIYTGFNGPGTGEIYTTYIKETEETIQKLINQR